MPLLRLGVLFRLLFVQPLLLTDLSQLLSVQALLLATLPLLLGVLVDVQ